MRSARLLVLGLWASLFLPWSPLLASQGEVEAHRTAAAARAETFFRYEFKVGSDASRVEQLKIETRVPEPISGWSGRYRTQGVAYLQVFDTKGWSSTRTKSAFEVITERKPGESIEVIDFSRKS